MKWQKLGNLYNPVGLSKHTKLLTHAANPLPIWMEGDIFRIFYSGRDAMNRSSVGAVDIDILQRRIIKHHDKPFFEYGSEDTFYRDGVSIGNVYEVDGIRYILFMGWQVKGLPHWRGDIGRLILRDDLTLKIESADPLMRTDEYDQISLSYPWVQKNKLGFYDMWYGSTLTWDAGNGEMIHTINYAQSQDGHTWKNKKIAIPYEIGKAQAFSRPTVIQNDDESYDMWFSYRNGAGQKYRIGHAASVDGAEWKLNLDHTGIDVSPEPYWDSEMLAYPYVFSHKGKRYMLYNGNGYGYSGFGLATLG